MDSGIPYSEILTWIDKVYSGEISFTEYVNYLSGNILKDLYKKHGNGRRVYSLADVKPGENASVLSINFDTKGFSYHFYKRESDYLWSEKPGNSEPSVHDNPFNTYSVEQFIAKRGVKETQLENYVPVAIFAYSDNS